MSIDPLLPKLYRAWLIGFNKAILAFTKDEGHTALELMKTLGFSDSSWYRRMEDPEYWKDAEIRQICDLIEYSVAFHDEYQELLFQLKNHVKAVGIQQKYLATKLGLNKEKLIRRFKNPELFTIDEVEIIVNQIEKFT